MTGGEAPGHTHRFRLFKRHVPTGRFAPLLLAIAIYVVLFIGVVAWLAWHNEETTQRRIALSPSISVTVAKTAPPAEDETKSDTAGAMPDDEQPAEGDDTASPLPIAPKPDTTKAPEAAPATPDAPAVTPATDTTQPTAEQTAEQQPAAETIAEAPAVEAPAPEPVQIPAWKQNASTFDVNDKRPRIGIIISNLGMAGAATRAAIEQTPPAVTLAFQSIAPDITDWIAKARTSGHEALLAVPMEPRNYPQNDPGPQTLLTTLTSTANIDRLDWALARSTQIIGIMPLQGEQFVSNEKAMAPVLDKLKEKGLVFVDGTGNPESTAFSLATIGQIPLARTDMTIDAAAARAAIDQALAELENQAKTHGQAIGVALPYPVTFERLNSWIKTLPSKNIVLAPISALVVQPVPPALPTAVQPATETTTAPAVTAPAPTPSAPKAPAVKKPAARPLSRITPEH